MTATFALSITLINTLREVGMWQSNVMLEFHPFDITPKVLITFEMNVHEGTTPLWSSLVTTPLRLVQMKRM